MSTLDIPYSYLLRLLPYALQAGYSLSDISTLLCTPQKRLHSTLTHLEASPLIASTNPTDVLSHSITLHGYNLNRSGSDQPQSGRVSWQSDPQWLDAKLTVPLTPETFKLLSLTPLLPFTIEDPTSGKKSPFHLTTPLVPQTEYLPQQTALSPRKLLELLHHYFDFTPEEHLYNLPCFQQTLLQVEASPSCETPKFPEKLPSAPPVLLSISLSTPNTPICDAADLGIHDIHPGATSYNAHTALYSAAYSLLRIYFLSHVLPSYAPNLAVGVHTSYTPHHHWKPLQLNSPEYFYAITSQPYQSFIYDTNNPPAHNSNENHPLKLALRKILPPLKTLKAATNPLQDCLQYILNLSPTHFPCPLSC